ncbi:hypothetical protein T12_5844 [Trichinella patagoniensis]|uniref:HTH psq-type domain-containing protein n=2 Tax=Trichinella patagoniensis TaxID=990121 RepID=A0A0V1AF57_9BILA|nr:hypothetical protein T12_5844 [Trichinella patagoniensis]
MPRCAIEHGQYRRQQMQAPAGVLPYVASAVSRWYPQHKTLISTGRAKDFHYFQLYIYVSYIAQNTLQLLYSVPGLVRSRLARIPALYAGFLKSRLHLYNINCCTDCHALRQLERMILPYTTKPSHVANKVVLNMIKRGSMPAGQRRFMFVVVCARWRWLDRVFKMEKKEWRQITTSQKLQIIQTVDENPNMKRIDIARMMKIPSSRLSAVRRYVCSFNVDENVVNQLSKIDTNPLPTSAQFRTTNRKADSTDANEQRPYSVAVSQITLHKPTIQRSLPREALCQCLGRAPAGVLPSDAAAVGC